MLLSAMVRLVQVIVSPASDWTGRGPQPTWVHIGSIIILLLEGLGVWFFWQGRNWARLLVMAMSGVSVARLLQLRELWNQSHAYGYWVMTNALLGAFLLFYLGTPEGGAWFAKRPAAESPAKMRSRTI